MKETTYLSSIISALNKLNGMGSLNEIYEAIEEEGKLNFIFIKTILYNLIYEDNNINNLL